MTSTYVLAGAGIGDFVYQYFVNPSWGWLYTQALRAAHPDIPICAVVATCDSRADELIALDPTIDVIIKYPWNAAWGMMTEENHDVWRVFLSTDCIPIARLVERHALVAAPHREVYLTKSETEQAHALLQTPSVVVHPFAGTMDRFCYAHYKEVCQELVSRGFQVLVLGRGEQAWEREPNHIEVLEIDEPGVVNLIDQASLRLSVYLARHAQGFIGTHSSMLAAAWTNQVPCIWFHPGKIPYRPPGTTGPAAFTRWAMGVDQSWTGRIDSHSGPTEVVNRLLDIVGEKG